MKKPTRECCQNSRISCTSSSSIYLIVCFYKCGFIPRISKLQNIGCSLISERREAHFNCRDEESEEGLWVSPATVPTTERESLLCWLGLSMAVGDDEKWGMSPSSRPIMDLWGVAWTRLTIAAPWGIVVAAVSLLLEPWMGVGLKFELLDFRNPCFKGNFFFEFGSLEFERGGKSDRWKFAFEGGMLVKP